MALENSNSGVLINGEELSKIRYADDTMIIDQETYTYVYYDKQQYHTVEIKYRTEKARSTFILIGNLSQSRDLNLDTKLRLYLDESVHKEVAVTQHSTKGVRYRPRNNSLT